MMRELDAIHRQIAVCSNLADGDMSLPRNGPALPRAENNASTC